MSILISYAVGNGDMFSIKHNSDNFTIIESSISEENRDWIIANLKNQGEAKKISRFISTHADQDHIMGLEYLDNEIPILNFYCVHNSATKVNETADFKHYCQLRDGDKAFYIHKNCTRKWMNLSDNEQGSSGLTVLWPDVNNADFQTALQHSKEGNSPNNISPILRYSLEDGGKFLWMGDLETDFMEKIEHEVEWPEVDILFAPHHGRDTGRVPQSILSRINPSIIVIGEAPTEHLNYYSGYKTITQNSAGSIVFECGRNLIHISVSSDSYSVDFLSDYTVDTYADNYIGSLEV